MCGIAGVVFDDPRRPVDESSLRAMCDRIRHRGPDDSGIWISGGIGLGHRRLSIIDLSPAGRQPMSNEDGSIWTIFNGEIYNFHALRKELEDAGHRFRSQSDTEVIVHLYEEDGDRCIERLQGMFALAIWDEPRRRLLLARDRLGKKPLKYASVDGGLIFASELKALLTCDEIARDVDRQAIHEYLSLGYVPAQRSGFQAIRKVRPGHTLVWEAGRTTERRYWSLDFRDKGERSTEDWCAALRDCVQSAVERRLISDVPLGAFLSGGVDSSIVVGCMARAQSRPVETFSIGFEHEAFNELPYAQQIADRFRTNHHPIVVRADEATLLPELARVYEEPFADPSALPSYLLARETRRHVTVALNGDGGDEGFAGYSRYQRFGRMDRRFAPLRSIGLGWLLNLVPVGGRRGAALSRMGRRELADRYPWFVRMFSDEEQREIYAATMLAKLQTPGDQELREALADARGGHGDLDRILHADTVTYLPDDLLVKMDLATMAHGLETRSPLLDPEVLELAARMPENLKLRGAESKWALKRAFRDLLPDEITHRRKTGFGIPIDDWMRGSLNPMFEDLVLAGDARIGAYLDPRAVRRWHADHHAGRRPVGRRLWCLLMLELWHREVVEQARDLPVGARVEARRLR